MSCHIETVNECRVKAISFNFFSLPLNSVYRKFVVNHQLSHLLVLEICFDVVLSDDALISTALLNGNRKDGPS